ncbi:hypothetical protein SY83_17870 [Paenibacillus swuensis]|uniref:TadE-like domain-containing protein n=1 Tax=Paenibacillus swuensis TaxID=1178515 RepID=A0A172TLE5_9BACL|nr:TadE family protein [Paenibacillus swuensis]ANE47850.1 hypothetical protein SY83_17870 [Paenibacillus swuensis]
MRKIIQGNQGALTVEASLVFPVVLLLTLSLIFTSVFIYQKSAMTVIVNQAAQRTANHWNNSFRSYNTGHYSLGQADGLYWRSLQDSNSDTFNFLWPNQPSRVEVGGEGVMESSGLPETKMAKALNEFPQGLNGQMAYSNKMFTRYVTVRLQSPFQMPLVSAGLWGTAGLQAEAKAAIVEPSEFIRSLDFVRTYMPYIQHYMSRTQLQLLLNRFKTATPVQTSTQTLAFRTHSEAKQFLQNTVGGRGSSATTEQTGEWRMIDALDSDGVAHQAYIGYQSSTRSLRDQLTKDLELMATGKVKGVVWHLFKKDGKEQWGLSKSLQKTLEQKGIIIVKHG